MKKFPSSKYPISPIIDETTYLCFCEWVETLDDLEFEDPIENDKKYAHLDALTTLIEAYETKNFKINNVKLNLAQIIEQAMEQLNFDKKDLVNILGSNRVSEIMNGKRQLSLVQIRKLHTELRIPTDILVGV